LEIVLRCRTPPRSVAVQATLAGLAAGVVGLALWRRRPDRGGAVSQTSRWARNVRLARLGARTGSSLALHRARRTFADAERRDALDTAFELKTAEQVAEALGQMKGALMKLGQMASYLDQGLPEHVRGALSELQAGAPPMSPELAVGMIRAELGADPHELFAEWDPVPMAAASIGQVHRAITHEGHAVAVKVQYPGVEQAMGADLDNVGLIFAGMAQFFPGLDHKPLVAELRDRLVEELDYHHEAANQQLFADYYDGHPTIHVPHVHPQYSTGRVLTTDLATGVALDQVVTWDQLQRNLASETIYRFAFGSLYRLHVFNGDPHPGNYLFRPDGHVTFLDFGLVKHFTDPEIDVFGEMIKAMVIDHDPAAFRRIIEDINLLKPGMAFTDDEIVDYLGHFYDFVLEDGPYTITSDYASETVRRFFNTGGPYGEIMRAANVPPFMVIIQRINLGLYAIFGELNATANWRRLAEELWPFVDGPASTPMGIEIEAWRARRHPAMMRGES
jgi:predicted unusual protein kinase regulating ubiquinone biosynthesis (AarF/ABC1/UbiB family)